MSQSALFIDFETRSPVDLKVAGLGRYSKHPATEVLVMTYAFDDQPIQEWRQGTPLPKRVRQHVESSGLVVAHNAQFELALWNGVMFQREHWPALSTRQVRCTMAACYAMGLPGALENAAYALGLQLHKDIEGRNLMLKMCKPKRAFQTPLPTQDGFSLGEEEVAVQCEGMTYIYVDSPEKRARLGQYCGVDTELERQIYGRVLPLSDREQRLWVVDQAINRRGIPFDMVSLEATFKAADAEKERMDGELAKATGGAVQACSAVPALKAFAADFGVMPDSLAKAELSELLDWEDLPDPVRDALKIRQAAGRFTSLSKLSSIRKREVAARVMYAFQYHAATTGRWAGRGLQPHNFTRDLPEPHEVEEILELIRSGRILDLNLLYGEPSIMMSKCLRGFIFSPDALLMGGDFSAVESRGLAWLSGEEWKLQAYREIDANPDLPDMYKRVYAKAFGLDPYSIDKNQRQGGKVMDLAFGFQGGVGAYRTMGKSYGIRVVKSMEEVKRPGGTIVLESEAEANKQGWRDSHPRTVQYWKGLQDAAIAAVRRPGEVFRAGAPGRHVMFRKRGSFLWCRLPSGRTLCYPYPVVYSGERGAFLTFKSVPDSIVWSRYVKWLEQDKKRGIENPTYIVEAEGNAREWCRVSTYGGKLSENITQAICRDLLAEAIMRVEAAGFQVVLHVHDEVIVEGLFTEDDRARFEELMCEAPAWAEGFPVKAGCWISQRYIK